jgi:Transposase
LTCADERTVRVSDPDVVWVGIDAGKSSHHAVAVDGEGRQLWSVKVANGQEPVEKLIARAGRAGSEVRWAVDLVSPMASLLLAVLLTSGQNVVYVPGRMVAGMAGLFGEGKTDLLTELPGAVSQVAGHTGTAVANVARRDRWRRSAAGSGRAGGAAGRVA